MTCVWILLLNWSVQKRIFSQIGKDVKDVVIPGKWRKQNEWVVKVGFSEIHWTQGKLNGNKCWQILITRQSSATTVKQQLISAMWSELIYFAAQEMPRITHEVYAVMWFGQGWWEAGSVRAEEKTSVTAEICKLIDHPYTALLFHWAFSQGRQTNPELKNTSTSPGSPTTVINYIFPFPLSHFHST